MLLVKFNFPVTLALYAEGEITMSEIFYEQISELAVVGREEKVTKHDDDDDDGGGTVMMI